MSTAAQVMANGDAVTAAGIGADDRVFVTSNRPDVIFEDRLLLKRHLILLQTLDLPSSSVLADWTGGVFPEGGEGLVKDMSLIASEGGLGTYVGEADQLDAMRRCKAANLLAAIAAYALASLPHDESYRCHGCKVPAFIMSDSNRVLAGCNVFTTYD